jgi:RNA polymerase sigma factor (sigma-70 family)
VCAVTAPTIFGCVGDDLLVMSRMRAGDDTALGDVMDRYGPLVLGVARSVTRSDALAEEVVQEVFTTLWIRPDGFDADRGTLRAYLGAMAHRRAVDSVRRSERQRRREERADALSAPVSADEFDVAVTSEAIRHAIGRLPEEQRLAVELAYWRGLTQQEVATALGIPVGTAKSRLRLASAKLREWLTPLSAWAV